MPDLPPLDAVLFDAGGTLVRLDFEWMSEWLAEHEFPVPAPRLRRAEVEGRRRYDASAATPHSADAPQPLGSRGDARMYLLGMLAAAGVPHPLQGEAVRAFVERQSGPGIWTRPMEGARAAIDGVRSLGLKAAVVSNSDGRAEQHLRDCGVYEGLEFVVDSHLVGVEKPDPRILEIALERLNVPAARAIYVGDILSVDEAAARAAGLHFTLIDPWGDYGPGRPSIAAISDLVPFLMRRFAPPQPAVTQPSDARRP